MAEYFRQNVETILGELRQAANARGPDNDGGDRRHGPWADQTDIHGGEQVCSRRFATGLLRRIALTARRHVGHDAAQPMPALTKRERQVAELISSGLSDKEIARRLNISLATTKSDVHNLLGKLNARRRSEVAEHWREHEQHPRQCSDAFE
jgi:DNA-binding CsgD family transcriptional regulator